MRQQVSGVLSQCRHWGAGRRRGESGHREPSNQLTSTSKKYNRRKLCAQPRSASSSSSSSHSALEEVEGESASSFISMNLDNEQWSSVRLGCEANRNILHLMKSVVSRVHYMLIFLDRHQASRRNEIISKFLKIEILNFFNASRVILVIIIIYFIIERLLIVCAVHLFILYFFNFTRNDTLYIFSLTLQF